jgi:halocyanin-like protein
MAGGAAATAAAGSAAAQEDGGGGGGNAVPVWPSYVDGAKDGSYEDLRGNDEVTVEVGAGSSGLAFSPTNIWIDPGTTITFEWVSPGHNVKPNTQPASDMTGSPGAETKLYSPEYSYTETLETSGMYTYYCQPHEASGMVGAIAVGEDVETRSTGGQTPLNPEHMGVPFQAHYVGIATLVMMVASLIFTFFLLKYGESAHTSGGNN